MRGVKEVCEGQPARPTRSTGQMKREDEWETKPTQNVEGRPKIETIARCPRFVEPKQLVQIWVLVKSRTPEFVAEATCTNSGLGETCKINRKTKRS